MFSKKYFSKTKHENQVCFARSENSCDGRPVSYSSVRVKTLQFRGKIALYASFGLINLVSIHSHTFCVKNYYHEIFQAYTTNIVSLLASDFL